MTEPALLIARDNRGVVRLTLNRPQVHNAFDEHLIATLAAAFEQLSGEPEVRAIVLASTGQTFCAGADIAWMKRAAMHDEQENFKDAQRFAAMMSSISNCPKPVIARIQGAAYGGGVGLACAADIAIAADSAKFVVSEAKLGIVPAVIGPYLVNAVGPRQARRLALTCTVISAAEALSIGLVQQVTEEISLDPAVEACLDALLQCGPNAQQTIKELFGRLVPGPVTSEIRDSTARTISRIRTTEEARAGFEAFESKRLPPWIKPS